MKHPKYPSEAQTLRACIDWLEAKKYLYIRIHPVRPFNDHKTGQLRFSKVRPSQIGVPDLIAWRKGSHNVEHWERLSFCFAIEVKSHKGKLSDAQRQWGYNSYQYGIKYMVVNSIEQLEDALR